MIDKGFKLIIIGIFNFSLLLLGVSLVATGELGIGIWLVIFAMGITWLLASDYEEQFAKGLNDGEKVE